ncbi:hypothetical protein EVAR_55879_1 [Eumeta japonica]|uniref:Uncharacterized protein n=1 Tax=Eumeta variegata TaxID=151549 RepID=A0A4C1YMU2_EUMVA|nr:hypothetical protein EVAR_55879_1 [Eumeta japonica]
MSIAAWSAGVARREGGRRPLAAPTPWVGSRRAHEIPRRFSSARGKAFNVDVVSPRMNGVLIRTWTRALAGPRRQNAPSNKKLRLSHGETSALPLMLF